MGLWRQEPAHAQAGDKRTAEHREFQNGPYHGDELAYSVTGQRGERHHGEIECHGVQRDGREGGHSHAAPFVFRQNSRPKFGREAFKAGQESRLSPGGAPGDNPHADDHGSDDAHRGRCHGKGKHLLHAVAGECFADGGRRPVSAAESGRHGQAEGSVQGPEKRQYPKAEGAAQRPLQEHARLGVGPHAPHPGFSLGSCLGGSKRDTTENQGDENAGVVAQLAGNRQPSQHLGPQDKAEETGQEAGRDEKPLDKLHLGTQEFSYE